MGVKRMRPLKNPESSFQLAVRNFASRDLKRYLEPWGDEFQMPPQAELVFVGDGPVTGSGFWVDYGEETIVVTAWTGSTVRVFSNGEEIGGAGPRPDALPASRTHRSALTRPARPLCRCGSQND